MSARLEAAVAELVASLEELVVKLAPEDDRPPVLLSVEQVARRLGIGRTSVYGQIAAGKLRSVKVGRRRLVPSDALGDLVASIAPKHD